MPQRQHLSMSTWLLQLFVPLCLLSSFILCIRLDENHGWVAGCPTQDIVTFVGFYGVLQFGVNSFIFKLDRSMPLGQCMTELGVGFALPSLIGIGQHHSALEPSGGLWQEFIVPAIVVIWIGLSAFHAHVSKATIGCSISPRVAIPISAFVVFLSIEACFQYTNVFANIAILIYSLTVCAVAGCYYLDETRTASAPS